MGRPLKSMIGYRSGILTVRVEIDKLYYANGSFIRRFNCDCECGATDVVRSYSALTNKNESHCGDTVKHPHANRGRKFKAGYRYQQDIKKRREVFKAPLTEAEKEQVERIIDSRRSRDRWHRREAVWTVKADRGVNDMVCHGGNEECL